MAAAPITGLLIRDCRFNIGRTDFSKDASMQLRGIIDVTIEAMAFENVSPCGYGHQGAGGRSVRVRDCSMVWTLATDALDNSNRQLISSGLNTYERCTIDANTSRTDDGRGLARLSLSGGDLGGRHVLQGGSITDTHLAIVGGAVVELQGVALAGCTWSVEDGSIAFTSCTLDGQPLADGTVGPG